MDSPKSLRIVIQQIGIAATPRYRVIIYGDNHTPRHSDFDSANVLLDTLRAATPDFDSSQLVLSPLEEAKARSFLPGRWSWTNGSSRFSGSVDEDPERASAV